ncbi:MAG: nitrous oxide reductase accessory protein NosL [Salibacteraceae bacterium]
MRIITIFCLLFTVVLGACSQSTKPIEYGKDNCHYCQMKIMDPKFGTEAVTKKGRVYKFDSSECLLRYLNDSDQEHSHIVVTDFASPKTFVGADSAWFLVSKNMPSPMGGFLNAFSDKGTAEKFKNEKGGDLHDWSSIKSAYDR